ncbi:cytochrome c553 (cytochrome c6) [Synechococcus sp. NOUM97013]|nr:cytochrome c553 (cytochrome c6) [Synechococcus sp. NOUM97013]
MPSSAATNSKRRTGRLNTSEGGWMLPLILSMLLALTLLWPAETLALPSSGAELFDLHCAGCHPNGGNIIRRGKTLKLKALEQQGINNAEAIAAIARTGIGQMSGYAEALGEGNDVIVADWIWEQAQKAWIQG